MEGTVSVVLEDDEMVSGGIRVVRGVETVDVLMSHVSKLQRERERKK